MKQIKGLESISAVELVFNLKHTAKATTDFMKTEKLNILQWTSQAPDFNPEARPKTFEP